MINQLNKRIENFYNFTDIQFGIVRVLYCILYYLIYDFPFKRGLGDIPDYLYAPNSSSLAYYLIPSIPHEYFFTVLNIVGVISFVCVFFGYRTVKAGILFSLILIFERSISFGFQKIDHSFFNDITFLVLGFTGWGSKLSIDEYLGKKGFVSNVWLMNFTLMFFLAWFSAGIFKALDTGYWNFNNHEVEKYILAYNKGVDFYQSMKELNPFGGNFIPESLDYSAIFFELGAFLVFINLRWTLIYIILCCVFHILNVKILGITFSGMNTFYMIMILLSLISTFNTKKLEKVIKKLITPRMFYLILIIVPVLYVYGYTPILIKKIGFINVQIIYIFGVLLSLYRLWKQSNIRKKQKAL